MGRLLVAVEEMELAVVEVEAVGAVGPERLHPRTVYLATSFQYPIDPVPFVLLNQLDRCREMRHSGPEAAFEAVPLEPSEQTRQLLRHRRRGY
jgi:hypothetical protein